MYTKYEFTYRWQRLHHPSMDVSGDVDFFYQYYCELYRLVKEDGGRIDEPAIRAWLLYTENTIAIGFDGIYIYRYRSLGGLLDSFSDRLKLTIGAVNRLHRLMS